MGFHATHKSLGLPPIPRTQALTSTTFNPPPLDGSLSVPELYDWHLENSPDHPLFIYSDDDGAAITITWKEAVCAVHKGGRLVRDIARKRVTADRTRFVFAILASNDSIVYFTLIAAIARAGHAAFPISPRNSPAAIAHLLSETDVTHIFVGAEDALQHLAAAALLVMSDTGKRTPEVARFPPIEDLYDSDSDATFELLPAVKFEWHDPVVILHSSGSTAFPKPLVYTHERLLLGCLAPWFGERDLTGQRLACHSMPMYHGMGIMQVGWTAFSGLVLTVFKSQVPAVVPSPESVMNGAMDTKSDLIFCVPSFVEEWAKKPQCVRWLQQTQGIIFGGGPLSREVGDYLTQQGVSVFIMYGNSECAINNVILPKQVGEDWEYFAFPANVKPHFVPCDDGNAELVLMSHRLQRPCVTNTSVDGVDGYATSDLVSPHPTKRGYWKILGRLDDQIMHSTGEKTNPGPLESILVQDPSIQSAIMFGRGRFNAGVLIDPITSERFDPTDQQQLAKYRNKIWPTLEKMNDFAPQHSRVFKEMILVSSPSKPFTYTAKNTPRRQAIINDYKEEIHALYAAVDETTLSDLALPTAWDLATVLNYVRTVVHRVLKHTVCDTDDIFQKGCDSLQATWMRNTLLHAMKGISNTRSFPNNFIYHHPTIFSLASLLSATAASDYSHAPRDHAIQDMHNLVAKHSTHLPVHKPLGRITSSSHDAIVVTGTTGVLGTAILLELLSLPEVGRIYAFNRKGRKSVMERQRFALQKQHANSDQVLASAKIIWIETDATKESLGVPSDSLQDIRANTTHIIHNAWPMNFNHSLQSYDESIRTVRWLVDLALSSSRPSTPRLIFCSSAGVLYNSDASQPVRETQVEPEIAVGSGYTESKWVAEKLLQVVAEQSALRPITIRIGQLCGSSSGYWNEAEWFPSLVRSSVFLRCFPSLDKSIALLPIEDAARAICQMRNSEIPLLHLAHPHSVNWATITNTVSVELGLQTVSYDVWFALLEKSGEALTADAEVEAARQNPALKLLGYFTLAKVKADSVQAMGMPQLDLSAASTVSPSLRRLMPLPEDLVLKWIQYWRRTGFLG